MNSKGQEGTKMVQGPKAHVKKGCKKKKSHWRVLKKREGVCAGDRAREGKQDSAAHPESKPALAS